MSEAKTDTQRNTAPVFVLGCPRSGTTLLYDMLLSAGGFAVYLAESNVFNVLALRFGDLSVRGNREKLLRAWLGSKLFRASGLEARQIEKKVLEECHHAGDFLRIVMDEIARMQGMRRWAENSPESLLHLPLIKKLIPRALVIHIVRDGRAVAMSLEKLRYVRPFPWEERQSLIGAGVYWEWMVQRGRRYGALLGPDYLEVRFEDLVTSPQPTLNQIGTFIDHELDYGRILQVAYGSVARPNTSFRTEAVGENFNPVHRWQTSFPPDQLLRFEMLLGDTLGQVGYRRMTDGPSRDLRAELKATRLVHRSYFEGKLWFKRNALIRRLRPSLTCAEIDTSVLAEDHPPEIRPVLSRPL
ncbi:MAG: sulfotransferase [Candidatus Sulfotelmatobacter sp.]